MGTHQYLIKGDQSLRLDYPLTSKSTVMDLGGYKGEWSKAISQKYDSTIYIFEPVKSFYLGIKSTFKSNNKIKVFQLGLSDSTRKEQITLLDNGSSIHRKDGQLEDIQLVNIVDFMTEHKIDFVDLIKINIEGEEFPLLFKLLDEGYTSKFENIQLQFHPYIENAENMRNDIRQRLSETHELTWSFDWLWDNWKLKKNS